MVSSDPPKESQTPLYGYILKDGKFIEDPNQTITEVDNPGAADGTFDTNDVWKDIACAKPVKDTGDETEKCWELCKKSQELKRKHCNYLRKRIVQLLKEKGCPSSIKAHKMKGCR